MTIFEDKRVAEEEEIKCQYCNEHIAIQFFRGMGIVQDSFDKYRTTEDYTWIPTLDGAAYFKGQKVKFVNPVEGGPEFLYVGVYHNIEGNYPT